MAYANIILCIVTIIYACLTWCVVAEMRKQRIDSARPILGAEWGLESLPPSRDRSFLFLVNHGNGPAVDVRAKVFYDGREKPDELKFFPAAIGSNRRVRTSIENGYGGPLIQRIEFFYQDIYGNQFMEQQLFSELQVEVLSV
jgi:hypothetical protein